jgi:hypothetical protein
MAINKNEQEGKQIFGSFSPYFRRDKIKVHNMIVAELVKKGPTRANVKYEYAERIIQLFLRKQH